MIFDSGILPGHSKGYLSVCLSKPWSTCKLIYLIVMCHWGGHFPSNSFYKCWKQTLKIRRFLCLNSFAWIEVLFTLIKCVTFSCFVLLKFRLEFCNANDCNITLHDYWVFIDGLKSVADEKTLFYMNASTIKTLMWMNQFNATIIFLAIASLFQIFSFHSSTCNKRYTAFT